MGFARPACLRKSALPSAARQGAALAAKAVFGLLLLLLAAAPSFAEAAGQAAPPAATLPALSPAQARQALELLQDDQRRAALIATLRTIAEAAPAVDAGAPAPASAAPTAAVPPATAPPVPGPAAAPPPATAPPAKPELPLAPGSLGAELLPAISTSLASLSGQIAATIRAVTKFPLLWQWLVYVSTDPSARAWLGDLAWRLVVVLGGGLAVEYVALRVARRPLGALEMPEERGRALLGEAPPPRLRGTRARRLLRRMPLVFARFALDLFPVVAFGIASFVLLGTAAGVSAATRMVILSIVDAYLLARGAMCVVRLLVAPSSPRLRLIGTSDQTAAYVEVWARRLTAVIVFGIAMAQIGSFLGLYAPARDGLVKLVALVVHLFLVIMTLQCRAAVARYLRAPPGAHAPVAVLRNRFAETWHYIAIFFNMAMWVVWAVKIQHGFARLLTFFALTVAVLIAARLVAIVALGTLDRLFHIDPAAALRFPGLERRANGYYRLLRGTVSTGIGVMTLLALLQVWGVDALGWLGSDVVARRLLAALATIGVAALIGVLIWEAANAAIDRQLARMAAGGHPVRTVRLRTLLPMLRTTLLVVILTVVGLTGLSEIGVNIGPLLAGAGIVGIAVGFGSQKLVQDLITGVFLLIENAMQVGDWVTVSGLSGAVENLSIRTIRLRASDGSVHIIPFSSVTSVTNTNRGTGNAAISVSLALKEDTDRVGELLKEIAAAMRHDPDLKDLMLSDLELWGVDKVNASGVTIVGQIACTASGRWSVQREFNRRMKKRFQELEIEIANPA